MSAADPRRVALGILIAPLAASFVAALAQPWYALLPDMGERILWSTLVYCFGAYPPALLFGVPAYLLLQDRVAPSLPNCMVAGAAVAVAPWLLIGLASIGSTLAGDDLAGIARAFGPIATYGAVGGAVFRLIAAPVGRVRRPSGATQR